MSPERIPETIRTSHGAAIGERRRLAEARKTDPQAERLMRFAIPSRGSVLNTLDQRTKTNKELNDLLNNEPYRKTLTEFIDARISIANGDRTLFTQFIERANPKSKTYDSEFSQQIDSLNTHFHIVLSLFPGKRR